MRFFKRSASRLNSQGCNNAGIPVAPIAPEQPVELLRDKNGRVHAEIGSMEPEIQAELDRILKDVPVPEDSAPDK